MRAAYGRAAATVVRLERTRAALQAELADLGDVDDRSVDQARRVVSFPDKSTRTEDIRREIDTALDELDDGQTWQEWLEFSQRFHRYSLNNQLLILTQNPDATRVAGFNKWKELGRSVNKGEKAIWIYAPMVKKIQVEDDNGATKRENRVVGFKVVPVFDVSSTSGDPLPEPPVISVSHLSGRAPDGMHEDLDDQIEGHGYRLEYRDLVGETSPGTMGNFTESPRVVRRERGCCAYYCHYMYCMFEGVVWRRADLQLSAS
ncbi:ArdC-like ssDNA-binding domain-containing protein [Mycobacterium xenopi]|uniref:ArdC-like ssDNA-binding domain-containing protein n=1 Tax=Mycobacterium xenopi TaxID=1789 RepID=UPI000DD7B3FA|nr:ArdC-like ssDNA-binding domain-containing protein [Mycobacterium xenopi]